MPVLVVYNNRGGPCVLGDGSKRLGVKTEMKLRAAALTPSLTTIWSGVQITGRKRRTNATMHCASMSLKMGTRVNNVLFSTSAT